MNGTTRNISDWGILEGAIRDGLRTHGSYQAELDPPGTQGLVDIQWAAFRAARGLGVRAKVDLREARADGRTIKTVLTVLTVRAHRKADHDQTARPGRPRLRS